MVVGAADAVFGKRPPTRRERRKARRRERAEIKATTSARLRQIKQGRTLTKGYRKGVKTQRKARRKRR